MTSYRCGHCGVHTAESGFHDTGIALYPGTDHSVKWRSVQCAACGRPTLIAQGWSTGDNVTPTMYFPPEGWEPVRNIAKVPGAVGEDYKEAVDCMRAGHYKAAAVLARRAVQGVCLDLKTDPELKLYEQIDELQKQGGITRRLAALAHKVRVLGNDGAHPGKDGLDTVEVDDAEQTISFLEHLLQHVYIIGD